jgi:chorismate synthase
LATNSIGNILRIHSFGESHGTSVGVIIDGLPAGLTVDIAFIQSELDRRRPGQSSIATQRVESDQVEISSGVFEGKSTGHPIHITIPNRSQKSSDYSGLKEVYRPSHADYTYQQKYEIRDHLGGGRASARITAAWVAAGAIAKLFLEQVSSIEICSFVKQIHSVSLDSTSLIDIKSIETNPVRCPNPEVAKEMIDIIKEAKEDGDSLGGIVHTSIKNCPIGLGDPVFEKLHANIGKYILSINACKGIAFGSGFDSVNMKGSEYNDGIAHNDGVTSTLTNHSGGIQGGISNGQEIYFDAVFRPTSSISKKQKTIDHSNSSVEISIEGRHDPCVVPRAVPIVEAMTALVLADHFLQSKLNKLSDLIK